MTTASGYFSIPSPNDVELIEGYRREGWRIYSLPKGISSKEAFFRAVRQTLPLDPPVIQDGVWEALSDSLWEGLSETSEEKILIVWHDGASMETSAPADAAIATVLLKDITVSLADAKRTLGAMKQVAVIKVT